MKNKQISLILVFMLLTLSIWAQNIDFERKNFPKDQHKNLKKVISWISDGDGFYKEGLQATYLHALKYYLPAYQFNPNNALLNFKIGVCYLNTGQGTTALPYLKTAYALLPGIDSDILMYLAEAHHYALNTDEAEALFRQYLEGLRSGKDEDRIQYVNRQILACQISKQLIQNPIRVFIDNVGPGINTHWPEYSPVINADESVLFFTSSRDNTTGGQRSKVDLQYFEDIYYSTMDNKEWSKAINPGSPLNTGDHDAVVGLSNDGNTLFLYKGENGGDLYYSNLKGDVWTKPRPLPGQVNTKSQEASASFSPDENVLYFTSDRKGGYGGSDIYLCRRSAKGKWGDVENLGPVINTPFDEQGVFMHPDGKTLYFSSRGHNSMGGYDIFYAVRHDSGWSKPVNIGFPVNTPDDDMFLVLTANARYGYYASARPGGMGDKDIYRITFLGPEKPVINDVEDQLLAGRIMPIRKISMEPEVALPENRLTLLRGYTLDAKSRQPIAAALELTDNETAELLSTFASNAKTGKFLIALPSGKNYGLAVTSPSYLFYSENFDIPAAKGYQEVNKEILLSKLEVGESIVLRNIFFDFDKASLRPQSRAELDRLAGLMKENNKMKVEISGHTDNIGQAAYNQKLSEARAKAVVDYLIEKGTASDRMEFKGYGFDRPIDTNETDEGRQMNRRTEFKVLSR